MNCSTSSGRKLSVWALAACIAAAMYASPLAAQDSNRTAGDRGAETARELESGETGESAVQSPARSGGNDALWWLYVSGLGLAVMIPLAYYAYRRFGAAAAYGGPSPGAAAEGGGFVESTSRDPPRREGQLARAEEEFFSAPESAASGPRVRMAFGASGDSERMCPECGEKFPASVVLCPHDSTPLETIEGSQSGSSPDETVLERQCCPGCGRRYAPGPDYCYHDGMQLRRDTVEGAEEAPEFKACETCGWEGSVEDRVCPNDGTELTVVAPADEGRATPPFPVLVCPECGTYAEPGRARCPEDDTVLTPVQNAHARELPEHGFGPRRKICQECGETFSRAADYCTRDGSELVTMN